MAVIENQSLLWYNFLIIITLPCEVLNMVIETGIDMVEIARIEKSTKSDRFMMRVYGEKELDYFKNNMSVQSMAAAFCAKEAFGKALEQDYQVLN